MQQKVEIDEIIGLYQRGGQEALRNLFSDVRIRSHSGTVLFVEFDALIHLIERYSLILESFLEISPEDLLP